MDCFPDLSGSLQLVGIAAFRDRVSVHVLVDPVRFLPVGLATTLRVPAVRRLCRPIMGSWHEVAAPRTEKAHKTLPHPPRSWITPALTTNGFRPSHMYQSPRLFGLNFFYPSTYTTSHTAFGI